MHFLSRLVLSLLSGIWWLVVAVTTAVCAVVFTLIGLPLAFFLFVVYPVVMVWLVGVAIYHWGDTEHWQSLWTLAKWSGLGFGLYALKSMSTTPSAHEMHRRMFDRSGVHASAARTLAAAVVGWGTLVGSWALFWQVIRFCEGRVGAPIIDQVAPLLVSRADAGLLDAAANRFYHFVGGVAVWITLGVLLQGLGYALGQVIQVGFAQYRREADEAARVATSLRQRQRQALEQLEASELARDDMCPRPRWSWRTFALGFMAGRLL